MKNCYILVRDCFKPFEGVCQSVYKRNYFPLISPRGTFNFIDTNRAPQFSIVQSSSIEIIESKYSGIKNGLENGYFCTCNLHCKDTFKTKKTLNGYSGYSSFLLRGIVCVDKETLVEWQVRFIGTRIALLPVMHYVSGSSHEHPLASTPLMGKSNTKFPNRIYLTLATWVISEIV